MSEMIEKIDKEIEDLENRIDQLKGLKQLIIDDPKRIKVTGVINSSCISFPETSND